MSPKDESKFPLKCKVVADYQSPLPFPLKADKGEPVALADESVEFPGWVWCENESGKGGWAPEEYLQREGDSAVFKVDYDGTELPVKADEVITVEKEIAGWFWCQNEAGESGWVPGEYLRQIVD